MTTKLTGFAALKQKDPARFAELMSLGGRSVPADKRAFSQDRALAQEAGRLGGLAVANRRR